MKKQYLFLLLLFFTKTYVTKKKSKKNLSSDYVALYNFIKKAQFAWKACCKSICPTELKGAEIQIFPEDEFEKFEKVLASKKTAMAKKQLAVLRQLKSDQGKLNKLPVKPFKETVKKFEKLYSE